MHKGLLQITTNLFEKSLATSSLSGSIACVPAVVIDSRTLNDGDVFVAIEGETHDGHDFVSMVMGKNAGAVVVKQGWGQKKESQDLLTSRPFSGLIVEVEDTVLAFQTLACYHRHLFHETNPKLKTIAVTGSVGKTTVKEMLGQTLKTVGPTVYAQNSFNNHLGVPLTLLRLKEDTQFLVCEVGTNHPGEIAPLSWLIAPDIAIITAIESAHQGAFDGIRGIAIEKADIMAGLAKPKGTVILPLDSPQFPFLLSAANLFGVGCIVTSGEHPKADLRLVRYESFFDHGIVHGTVFGEQVSYRIQVHGPHNGLNTLIAIGAMVLAGVNLNCAIEGVTNFLPVNGRGNRMVINIPPEKMNKAVDKNDSKRVLLIDETYNTNPASMTKALENLGAMNLQGIWKRRVAILGDMYELGDEETTKHFHRQMASVLEGQNIEMVVGFGPYTKLCLDAVVRPTVKTHWFPSLDELEKKIWLLVEDGDVVLCKASNGTGLHRLSHQWSQTLKTSL